MNRTSLSKETKRDGFGSFFGALVAAAGSAVGLGNLWRFPYIVGANGGAAFILIYLCFVFIICLPVMLAEFIIGRRSQSNVIEAFKKLAPHRHWYFIGIISVLAVLCILAFYSVVGGWTLDYLFNSLVDVFEKVNPVALESQFLNMIATPVRPIFWTLLFLIFTCIIVSIGIEKGIEKFSKILMPVLFVMILILVIRSITLPGSGGGLNFLFRPDFSKINAQTILAALGQAFFSLSLGMGCMITYGSYIQKKENLTRLACCTIGADTLFAILAGIAIMPAVFAFGISPGEGPGLVFITLPRIFAQIPLGNGFAILFFIILFIAAITSAISLFEVVVAYGNEKLHIKRPVMVGITFIVVSICAAFSSLSQGILKDWTLFGKSIFDCFDYLSANILLPLGGLLIVLFVGWALKPQEVRDELSNQGLFKIKLFKLLIFILRYVAPLAIVFVFLHSIGLF